MVTAVRLQLRVEICEAIASLKGQVAASPPAPCADGAAPAIPAAPRAGLKRRAPCALASNRAKHPANRYAHTEPDFAALAAKYPALREHVTIRGGRGSVNFKSWHATRELTRALLMEDFHLTDWQLPEGHLVPTVPNRLNYLHWISDLLNLSSLSGALLGLRS